jgi:integrase/recombinase XerD
VTALAHEPPVIELGAMMRRLEVALRNREWEGCPVGAEVSQFIRALRWSQHSPHTIRAYESVLGLLALRHSDWDSVEDFCSAMGIEYLREFLDAEWGGCAPATKKRQVAILHSFFGWLADERRIPWDPSRTIKGPKVSRQARRTAYDVGVMHKLVVAQDTDREQAALELLCKLGLRRAELGAVMIGELDLIRGYVFIHGKGRKDELMPLPPSMLGETSTFYLHVRERHPKEYLLYGRNRRFEPMSQAGIHNWFKRCVRQAGLPETMTMHEMRHSAADAIRRERGDISLATQLLRHSSVATTDAYLHPTKVELREAMAAMDEVWGAV